MPCRLSKEVIGALNSLENWGTQRQLSMDELPPQTPSCYFSALLCLLCIIASSNSHHRITYFVINIQIMSVLCRFYVGFMSVLCQFDVYLRSNNSLIINYVSSKLCRMSVVFAFFFSLKLLLLANSVSFLSLRVQITQIFSANRRCFPIFCYLRNPCFNHIFRRADEK